MGSAEYVPLPDVAYCHESQINPSTGKPFDIAVCQTAIDSQASSPDAFPLIENGNVSNLHLEPQEGQTIQAYGFPDAFGNYVEGKNIHLNVVRVTATVRQVEKSHLWCEIERIEPLKKPPHGNNRVNLNGLSGAPAYINLDGSGVFAGIVTHQQIDFIRVLRSSIVTNFAHYVSTLNITRT